MDYRGSSWLGLAATAALFALAPTGASAASVIAVNDSSSDAQLAGGAGTCESTDAGAGCTLRAAVELADRNGGAVTITVPGGKYLDTSLGGGSLRIENDAAVTISGASAPSTTIDGGGTDGVFRVEQGSALTLHAVTIQHGSEDEGGGVAVDSGAELVVEESTITHNDGGDAGGGIFLGDGATLALSFSTVTDNEADEGGGIFAVPGATVLVEGSTIDGNTASEGDGGAILGGEQEAFTANAHPQSCFARRAALRGADADAGGAFGGVTVEDSAIEGNAARGAGSEDGAGDGGGVYVAEEQDECDGALPTAARAARRASPTARPAARRAGPATSFGVEEEAGLTIEGSTVAHNEADGEGGGIYEEGELDPIVNSTIADNIALLDGGGLSASEADTAELISDTFAGNTVLEAVPGAVRAAGEQVRASAGNNLSGGDGSLIGIRDTLLAEQPGVNNCDGEVQPLEEGAGYNLDFPSLAFGDGARDSCGMNEAEHDLVNVSPDLDPAGLQNNGGSTKTIALLAESPAIGFVPLAGNCEAPAADGPLGIDQRGEPRPGIAGDGCDVGAYEYQAPAAGEEPAKEPNVEPAPRPLASANVGALAFTATGAARCRSERDIRIHIQNVKQLGLVSATVSIDGKHARRLSGRRLTTAIDLRGLPKGTFTVEIVARERGGKIIKGKRVYHTCRTKLPGHSYLPL